MKHFIFVFLVSILFVLNACESEKSTPTVSNLQGNWIVYKAMRNNKATRMLDGTWFQFTPNQMRTNLPSESESSEITTAYTLEGDQLTQKSEPSVIYTIKNWSDSTYTLGFAVQGKDFELSLRKTVQLPQSPTDTTLIEANTSDSIQ